MKKIITLLILLFFLPMGLSAAGWYDMLLPEYLVNTSGRRFDTARELHGKTVLLYFSAHWCGPCRNFTPELVKFYRSNARSGNLIVVFVSSDRDKKAMHSYMKDAHMPWLAVPYDAPERQKLKKKFNVSGIPTLIVLSPEGRKLSDSARWDVVLLGSRALAAWKSPQYKPKTYQDYLNRSQAGKKQNKGKDKKK